jgi:putative (di)nucleoside polyphosphate hydrolase
MSDIVIDPMANAPYRPCVGIMLLNADGHVFVGQRFDSRYNAWQMPQGGIDDGEDCAVAALRELGEETGIAPHHVAVIAQSANELFYDLPDELMGRMWDGAYRGQRQIWFLMRFLGDESDINIATEIPEFAAWRWAAPETLVDLIVPFKKELYAHVIAEFAPHL